MYGTIQYAYVAMWPHTYYKKIIYYINEGKATRLAELAIAQSYIINRDKNKSQFRQTCCLPFKLIYIKIYILYIHLNKASVPVIY